MEILDDTIAAIATPPGESGIAVIRISGPDSLEIIRKVFLSARFEVIEEFTSHKLVYGCVYDAKRQLVLDNSVCVYMKAPKSYTGEDTVEIYCHGGYVVPKSILDLVVSSGARPAGPGEFTKRAFLNGKMDLAQAESVANIIHAQTESGLRYAGSQLKGVLSRKINLFKETLLDILAETEAYVDFPEEGIDESDKDRIITTVRDMIENINELITTYSTGKIYKNGINTIILGKPNVGKSSLLNRLLDHDRAIVSSVAGTTRDFIEEVIDIKGIPLKIVDTAGIRLTDDEVERIGVTLAGSKAREAEFLLIVLDASQELDENDIEVIKNASDKNGVFVLNKSDLNVQTDAMVLGEYLCGRPCVHISALSGEGISELKNKVYECIVKNENLNESSELVLTDLRHRQALEKCIKHLRAFLELVEIDESPEFLAMDLRVAMDSLGEITGEVTTEDILGRIFSKFCIGK